VQAASKDGVAGALFYLFAYMVMVLGAFAVVSLVGSKGEAHNDLESYRGLASRRPVLALSLVVFLLAQAGVPFTTGFLAKFYVVRAAVDQGQYALAVIAMLAAAIAAFFYLRLGILMYSPSGSAEPVAESGGGSVAVAAPAETDRITIPAAMGVALVLCVGFTLVMGIAPAPMIDVAKKATLLF
jgi:NADH-quinone oxidoreductase subunit N